MHRVGSGALSPKAIMDSITAKGNEFLQGRRGPGILSNDVRPLARERSKDLSRSRLGNAFLTRLWRERRLDALAVGGQESRCCGE